MTAAGCVRTREIRRRPHTMRDTNFSSTVLLRSPFQRRAASPCINAISLLTRGIGSHSDNAALQWPCHLAPLHCRHDLLWTSSAVVRILFVSDVYFRHVNGVLTSIQTFRHELASLGHETTLTAPAYPAESHDDRSILQVASRGVPQDPEVRLINWSQLRRLHADLGRRCFDLIQTQRRFRAYYAGISLARRWGLLAIATERCSRSTYTTRKLFPQRSVMRALARGFRAASATRWMPGSYRRPQ